MDIALLKPVATPPCLLHNPLPDVVNGSLWTIRYEFWCYLLVLAFGMAGLLRRRAAVLALFAVAYGVLLAQTYTHWLRLPHAEMRLLGAPNQWPRLATFFLAGAVVYLYADRIVLARRMCALCLLALAVAAATTGVLGLLPLAGSYALFYAAFAPGLRARNFGRHGDFSYGIYLYAFPVQQLIVLWSGARLGPYSLFVFAFCVTLCLAVLSWRFVEEPFLRRKRAPAEVPVVPNPETAGAGV